MGSGVDLPMTNYEQLQDIMSDVFAVPRQRITRDLAAEDLEVWDSLQHLNFILVLESRFDLKLDVEDWQNLTSVPAILEFLDSRYPSN